MILVDRQIRNAVKTGELRIENYVESSIQPASYDLRVGPLIYSGSSPHPDHPIDLSKNGGAHRIPPYGNVIVTTNETLRLPSTMTGRFGLKSGFTRKGLHASAGPQVDPGFEGKLFVSILNLTPASQVIAYEQEFLSIEFHQLSEAPEHTYSGPYQGRSEIGREILEDLVRLEGINLSDMQAQFSELARHVQQWSSLASKLDVFLESMNRHSTAIEALVRRGEVELTPVHEMQTEEARQISNEQARTEILKLFKAEERLFYSDIAEKLRLDVATVVRVCDQLQEEGLIEGEPDG